ncbi:diaminohydroxyphosphoribosylaminopyrimidine deaminase [Bacteroidales bacterium 6E]|nr:diaminohydroxyphosphoribosylaminopyrimidine deaminase [Bacteroidales bacterium 6E]
MPSMFDNEMDKHRLYMNRCIELATLGSGTTAPNPMVGCVIVRNGKIIGEGYHIQHGGPHAEVNAINSVRDKEWLKESTLYVSLEPCAHYGKTPPCSDLIIRMGIPRVVIGTSDPFAEVSGRGIEKLKKSGVDVLTGLLGAECRWLNRRFFTFHEKKRPYVILKWAQSADGFMAPDKNRKERQPVWITNELSRQFVHKCRSEEASILVGTQTAIEDNPTLTVRDWAGQSPLRLVIDRKGMIPENSHLLDGSKETVVFTEKDGASKNLITYITLDFKLNILPHILQYLYQREILSVYIEGGAKTLEHFIEQGIWDEAHLFFGPGFMGSGVRSPEISGIVMSNEVFDDDRLIVLLNGSLNH